VLGRLHADATAFYAAQLAGDTPAAAHARQVLGQRGVSQAELAGYEIGYAPRVGPCWPSTCAAAATPIPSCSPPGSGWPPGAGALSTGSATG